MNSRFGKYLVQEALGVGGMASVYRAIDEQSEQIVALKILRAQWAADSDSLRRFRREAEIARKLQHPHIVAIYEYGEVQGRPYLAMQYMPGGSLAQLFDKPARMSLLVSAHLIQQIASALDYAHARGVVHRDLKLENVLLDDEQRAALSDFGIARVADLTRLTATGQIAGTPLYMAPEQTRGKMEVDHRADQYSLAVMAYLMACGQYPFSDSDPFVVLNQHLHRIPDMPSQVNPQLPRALDMALLKGLAKRPEDRYASAGEFAQAYEDATKGVGAVKTLILTSTPTPVFPEDSEAAGVPGVIAETPPASPRKARNLVRAVLALFIVGIAALLLGLGGRGLIQSAPPTATPTGSKSADATTTATRTPASPTATATPSPSQPPTATVTRVPPTRTRVPASPTPQPSSTPVPPTPVPPTPVPPTPVPPTPVPPTPAPPTPAPQPTSILPVPLPTLPLPLPGL